MAFYSKKKLLNNSFIMNSILMFFLLFFLFLISGCNDAPTEIGTEFLSDTLTIKIFNENDSIINRTESYYYNSPVERNTGLILVGITDKIKAISLIRYSIPVDKKDISVEDIISCELFFPLDTYFVGDSISNQLNFEIKEVTQSWNINTTTFEEVNNTSLFTDGKFIGEWTGNIERKDTLDTLIFNFSKDLCVKWLQDINDGINITDTIWGIGIIPKVGSTIINGFAADLINKKNSFIKVIYQQNNTIDSFIINSAENVSFINSSETLDKNSIIIQSGVRVHSRIYIDFKELSKYSCVNSTEITLFLDIEKCSLNSNIKNLDTSLCLAYIGDSSLTEKFIHFKSRILGQYDSTEKKVTFRINGHDAMNYILRKTSGIGELILMNSTPVNEHNYLDKWVFFGMNCSEISKQPKIKLFITKHSF